MNSSPNSVFPIVPKTWKILLALALVYGSWGTTYIAIHEGVKTMPPALFGGTRITLAGLLLLVYLLARKQFVLLPWHDVLWAWLVGVLLFVFGNGLISVAQKTVPPGLASILVATTPLWMALLEVVCPWGDRLTWRGWLGLLAGPVGVGLLRAARPPSQEADATILGPLLILVSAAGWALGSFVTRYRRAGHSPFVVAAYQMILGGLTLTLVGLVAGEGSQLTAESFTPNAVAAFFYLLVVGSLIGFVAYAWLLGNVSTTLAGTYAYINPVVAVFAAVWWVKEPIGLPVVGGMTVILLGVVLVRQGGSVKKSRVLFDDTGKPMPETPRADIAGLVPRTELAGRD
jgi:drug/metabolite transporter (DMT)-like permease